jgi:hypothetical protein
VKANVYTTLICDCGAALTSVKGGFLLHGKLNFGKHCPNEGKVYNGLTLELTEADSEDTAKVHQKGQGR